LFNICLVNIFVGQCSVLLVADPGAAAVRVLVPQRQDHLLRHQADQGVLRLRLGIDIIQIDPLQYIGTAITWARGGAAAEARDLYWEKIVLFEISLPEGERG
jgi:hypothetical protein